MKVVSALQRAQEHARVAVAVELYTIPYYLSALASLRDTSGPAYASVMSVCTEEMLHLQLAANLCLALGTTPDFRAPVYGVAPVFPDGTPILDSFDPGTGDKGVINAKIGNLVDALPTMLDIEVPTEFESGATRPPYRSIGQMYGALQRLVRLAGSEVPWTLTNQVSSYFPSQSFPQTIARFSDVVAAVGVICEQGEGQPMSPPPKPPFSAADFVVMESDLTVGVGSVPPRLAQLSHFGRFLEIQQMNLTSRDVYVGVAAPNSAENQQLQRDFKALLQNLNDLWSGKPGVTLWNKPAMPSLLSDAAAVWAVGNIPQWTAD